MFTLKWRHKQEEDLTLASFDKRRIVIIAGVAQANAAQKLLPFDNYHT